MLGFRASLVSLLICSLVVSGCQTSTHSQMITEYRPRNPVLKEHAAADSQVIELVRWQPVAPVVKSSTSSTQPTHQMLVEVQQVYINRGETIGFRRENGHLLAVAGPTTKELVEAHYEWKSVAGQPSAGDESFHRAVDGVLTVVGVVALVAIIGGLLYLDARDKSRCDCP